MSDPRFKLLWAVVVAMPASILLEGCGPRPPSDCEIYGEDSFQCCRERQKQARKRRDDRCWSRYWRGLLDYPELKDCLQDSYIEYLEGVTFCRDNTEENEGASPNEEEILTAPIVDVAEPHDPLAIPAGATIELLVREPDAPIGFDPVEVLPDEWTEETRNELRDMLFLPELSSEPNRVRFAVLQLDDTRLEDQLIANGSLFNDWIEIGVDEDVSDGIPSVTFETTGLKPGGYATRAILEYPDGLVYAGGVLTIRP